MLYCPPKRETMNTKKYAREWDVIADLLVKEAFEDQHNGEYTPIMGVRYRETEEGTEVCPLLFDTTRLDPPVCSNKLEVKECQD